jgi:hypothetical protein
MNQTLLRLDTASPNDSDTIEVYSAGIEIHDTDPVIIRPNIIDTRMVPKQKLVFTDYHKSEPVKSTYQSQIDTAKRVQRLRDQAILQHHSKHNTNIVVQKANANWRLVLGYGIAVLLLALIVVPLFGRVATALASL